MKSPLLLYFTIFFSSVAVFLEYLFDHVPNTIHKTGHFLLGDADPVKVHAGGFLVDQAALVLYDRDIHLVVLRCVAHRLPSIPFVATAASIILPAANCASMIRLVSH